MLNPALTVLVAVATDDGAPVDDGSPMGAVLALTAANSTPGECLSVARYRFLHHTVVSFVSSDIRVFEHGRDATAAMPIDTGRVVDGVSDRGFGTDAFADEVLFADVVDFDPHSAWDDGDEVTAALPDGAHTATTTVVATGAKRKRGHRKHVTQDARKHQRRRPLAIHGSAPGTDTGSGVRQSDNTLDRAGPEGQGGWRCG